MQTDGARPKAASRNSLSFSRQYIDASINKALINKVATERRSSLHGCYNLRSTAHTHVDVNSESDDTRGPSERLPPARSEMVHIREAARSGLSHPRARSEMLNNTDESSDTWAPRCRSTGVKTPSARCTNKPQIIQEGSIFCVLASPRHHCTPPEYLTRLPRSRAIWQSGRMSEFELTANSQPPTHHLWEKASIIHPFRWRALMCVSDSCRLAIEHPSLASLPAAVIALFCRQYDIIKDNDSSNNKEKAKPMSERSTPEHHSGGGLLRSKVSRADQCLRFHLHGSHFDLARVRMSEENGERGSRPSR